MKAVMGVDPRLMSMFGRKLYASPTAQIVARELLQNSRDAALRCGRTPSIDVTIDYSTYTNTAKITVLDNGEGMDARDIAEKLFILGVSSKANDPNSIGGFGIAKAAILSCDDWTVRSHAAYIDRDMFNRGDDIREDMPYLDGCEIVCTIKETYSWNYARIAGMFYFSDTPVNLTIIDRQGTTLILNDVVSLPSSRKLVAHDESDGSKYSLYLLQAFPSVDGTDTIETKGKTVYRIGGLAQYFTYEQDRSSNIVIDVDPGNLRPEDADYPFNMSREQIGRIPPKIREYLALATVNPISTDVDAATPKKNKTVFGGRAFWGKRSPVTSTMLFNRAGGYASRSLVSRPVQSLRASLGEDAGGGLADPNFDKPMIALVDYEHGKTRPHKDHLGLLNAWSYALMEVEDGPFAIGITSNTSIQAMLDKGIIKDINCYVICDKMLSEFTDPRHLALKLWHLCVHEFTHKTLEEHGERFTITFEDTLDEMAAQQLEFVHHIWDILSLKIKVE